MMAPSHPPLEAQTFQQRAQIVETDRRIRGPAKKPLKRLGGAHQNIVPRLRGAADVGFFARHPGQNPLLQQAEVDFHGRGDRDGLTVLEPRAEAPLHDGLDSLLIQSQTD